MLATSPLPSPVVLVMSSSGPSNWPSNLLKCPRTVDTARCFAVKPTVVCALSISYLTMWSSCDLSAAAPQPITKYLLAQATIPGGGSGGRSPVVGLGLLVPAEPDTG